MSEEAPSCPSGPETMARAMGYIQEVQVCDTFSQPCRMVVCEREVVDLPR
jgi:hypothetical protein